MACAVGKVCTYHTDDDSVQYIGSQGETSGKTLTQAVAGMNSLNPIRWNSRILCNATKGSRGAGGSRKTTGQPEGVSGKYRSFSVRSDRFPTLLESGLVVRNFCFSLGRDSEAGEVKHMGRVGETLTRNSSSEGFGCNPDGTL